MTYFYVLEGKIARLDRNNNPYKLLGLCTDNITSDTIIITIVSKDNSRYVLIHGDLSLCSEVIKQQMHWAGTGAFVCAYQRREGRQLNNCNDPLSETTSADLWENVVFDAYEFVPNEKDVVLINLTEKRGDLLSCLPEETWYHPQSLIISVRHKVEMLSGQAQLISNALGRTYTQPLIFDCHSYQKYDNFKLSPTMYADLISYALRDNQNLGEMEPIKPNSVKTIQAVYIFYYYLFCELGKNMDLAFVLERYRELLPLDIEIASTIMNTLFKQFPKDKFLPFSPPAIATKSSIFTSSKQVVEFWLKDITGRDDWGVSNLGTMAVNNNIDSHALASLERVFQHFQDAGILIELSKKIEPYRVILKNIKISAIDKVSAMAPLGPEDSKLLRYVARQCGFR